MTTTFYNRVDELKRAVGHGKLRMTNTMDQVYAKYQELREDLKHPRGGGAHYTRRGLFDHIDDYMSQLAARAVTPDGSELDSAARDVSDRMGERAEEYAPVEYANLRRSRHARVWDDGELIYNRLPDVPRLSEAQLRAQRRHGHGLDFGDSTRPRLAP